MESCQPVKRIRDKKKNIHFFPPKLNPHLFAFTKIKNESKSFIVLHGYPLSNIASLGNDISTGGLRKL